MKIIKWTLIWLYVITVLYVCMRGCVSVEGAEGEFSIGYHKEDIFFKESKVDFPDRGFLLFWQLPLE